MQIQLGESIRPPSRGPAAPIGIAQWYKSASLQSKLILPYVLLTLLLATVGTYVLTRLVTGSIQEKFINQLYESTRVSSDGVARKERTHLEQLRLMAFTQGVPDAIVKQDRAGLKTLLLPLIMNSGVEILSVTDATGKELISFTRNSSTGEYKTSQDGDFSKLDLIKRTLSGSADPQGDKYVAIMTTQDGSSLFTSAPVHDQNNRVSGVLLIGTRLETLVYELKAQTLADVIILDPNQHLLATTLAGKEEDLKSLVTAASSNDTTPHRISVYGRDFQVVYAPLMARNQKAGYLGVILPISYVVTTESTSRNTFVLIFSFAVIAMIVIGYLLSQSIARPVLKLRSLSQAVAAGDLTQTANLDRGDEIGQLAMAFDAMTSQLRERTAEAERLYSQSLQRNAELAEMNERLQSTQRQLIQSEKLAAIGKLSAGIVHDIKNPLAAITGLAELMIEDSQAAEHWTKELHLIHESAKKANRIVNDLLKFSRQSKPELMYADLVDTLEAALRLTAFPIRKGKVKIETDFPSVPLRMMFDPQQIEQVFVNMINNAIQAMPDGGTLRVTLSVQDRVAAVAFQDTGIGIPPENLGRIFDPFFTTKPEGEGTGLGLSVGYGIIASHNGAIEVHSSVDQGTTFIILLPVERPGLDTGDTSQEEMSNGA